MAKIHLPQIDSDTREALNKVVHGASSKSIDSLKKKGVTGNCEVLLQSVGNGYAMFRVNGNLVRANFTCTSDRRTREKVRQNRVWIPNSSVALEKYVSDLNRKLEMKIKLHDNLKKAKANFKKA
ncbi:hypothetical protein OTK49_02980 [Vibrio coralliirubri]|uniref:hypothetical protein n=1 Tax=Vibrio coralliirubri TaxID=1516159 RepID=UPI0022844AC5|nr:hypothetical protein [Vibrio coralliirubri]MCY9861479.1 hypothetical protein [Vibrio coralliirubri]